jgi:hypothetical protein
MLDKKSVIYPLLQGAFAIFLSANVLHAEDNVLTNAEKTEGYKLLFDGTLDSWKANWVDYVQNDSTNTTLSSSWKVNTTDHTITLPTGNTRDIRSKKKYKDFELRWKYRIDGNQGVVYRALLTYQNAWYTGVEYAINDVTNLGKDNPSAAYDLYAPNPVKYNTFSTGLWNEARIVVIGDSVEHWSNGEKVVGYKYHSQAFWAVYNAPGCKWPTTGNRSLTNIVAGTQDVGTGYIPEGYFSIQGDHGGKWQIKDMKVTETPCFGPIKADGSVCPVTTAIGQANGEQRLPMVRQRVAGRLVLEFPGESIRGATLLGLDGRSLGRAAVSGGSKAEFDITPKAGLYLLRTETASGTHIQKLNLL